MAESRQEQLFFEKTFSHYSPEETLDALKLFTETENAVIRVLFHSQNARNTKEIRAEISQEITLSVIRKFNITIPSAFTQPVKVPSGNRAGNTIVMVGDENKSGGFSASYSFEVKDLRKAVFDKSHPLGPRLGLVNAVVGGRKNLAEYIILCSAILAKEGYCEIPSFATIELALRNLLSQGFLVWRPSGNKRGKKGLFALSPPFYQQLKRAGFEKLKAENYA